MGFGKKKTRGPISKAYFRGGDIEKALDEVKSHYIEGVQSESAKDAWESGVMGFTSYFVPKVDDVVRDLRARINDPYARMEQVLKAESKIAAEYDRIKRDKMLENEKKAFQSGVITSNSTALATGFRMMGFGASGTKKVTI